MHSFIKLQDFACFNEACPDFGKKGKGNLFVKEFRGKKNRALIKCKTCNKCFCETHGTSLFALKTSKIEIANTLVLIPELGSIRAVARYTNHKADTIISWIELVNNNIEEFNEYFLKNFHFSENRLNKMLAYINRRKRGNNGKISSGNR